MIGFLALVLFGAASAYFGYLFGLRTERGRQERLAEIAAEIRNTGGVKLRRISVRR